MGKVKTILLSLVKGLALISLILLIFFLLKTRIDFSRFTDIAYIVDSINSFGLLAPFIFILIMAIAIIFSPLPSLPLAAAAGALWGPYLGMSYSVIGAEIGAVISFFIARFVGRPAIEKLFRRNLNFLESFDNKVLMWVVFVTRLFPFFQFDIVSYGAGLTKMRVKNFAIATFFGMIPMSFIFAYFGKSFFSGNTILIFALLLLVILMFFVPWLIAKYNFFGLKKKIEKLK